MVRGIGKVKTKKTKKKTAMEKDIERVKDISTAYLQGGKAMGEVSKKLVDKPKKKKAEKK